VNKKEKRKDGRLEIKRKERTKQDGRKEAENA
jgi:hypothetical protein